MKKHILEIKRLVSELKCMGTYGMVELELNEIEKEFNSHPVYSIIHKASGAIYGYCHDRDKAEDIVSKKDGYEVEEVKFIG